MIGRYFPMTCVLAGAMLGLGMLAGCRSQSALSFPTIAPGFPFQNNGPTTAVSYNARGVQRLQVRNVSGALEDFREAVRLEPENARFQLNFGWTLVLLQDYETALVALNRAVALNPNDPEAIWKRGVARRFLKDLGGAMDDYTQALELDPASVGARANRASLQLMLGHWKEAEEDFTLALKQGPNADFFAGRAEGRINLHDLIGANLDLSQAIELNSKDSTLYIRRAQVRSTLLDYPGALRDLDMAVELKPSEARYYWLRARLRHALHNHVGAQQDYESALRLDPTLRDKIPKSEEPI